MNIRPYIILNGVSSQSIQGLLISELAPISKPQVRTQVETVDGRDGDLVTPLGFSAYDKVITIGLTYGYDIDDVIEYFNSEGVVVFSNEPDKFYRYAIYEQIDFDKLIRFKKAEVTLHCQPFKFSTTEDPKLFNVVSGQPITVKNNGNIYSRPDITVIGSGEVDLSLNGSQILSLELADNQAVIIDSEDMNAYAAQSAIREVVADVEPIQDLHGQSNPYPEGGGKNLLKIKDDFTYNQHGVTISLIKDNDNNILGLDINGTADSNFDCYPFVSLNLPQDTYYITTSLTQEFVGFQMVETPDYVGIKTNAVFTNKAVNSCYIGVTSGTVFNHLKIYPMVCLNSVSDKSFAPYGNICPITGFTEANVSRVGKNLFSYDLQLYSGYWLADGLHGGNAVSYEAAQSWCFYLIPVVENTQITISNMQALGGVYGAFLQDTADNVVERFLNTNINATYTVPAGANFIGIPINRGISPNQTDVKADYPNAQIEFGSEASDYEAYNGTIYNIAFTDGDNPLTVYGGSLNVTTGVLTITHGIVDLGSLNWVYATGDNNYFYSSAISDFKFVSADTINYICENYEAISVNQRYIDKAIFVNSAKNAVIQDTTYTDAAAFKTAMSGVQLVYELATPITVQLTPAQVNNLLGVNTLYTDTNGDITVKHKSNGVIVTNTGAIVSFTVAVEDMEKGALLNRLVTGDYDKIRLKKGDNTIVLTGNAQQFVIDKYSRWI